jgi:hypothetical protein
LVGTAPLFANLFCALTKGTRSHKRHEKCRKDDRPPWSTDSTGDPCDRDDGICANLAPRSPQPTTQRQPPLQAAWP